MCHVVTDHSENNSKPQFNSLEQIRYGIRNNKIMVFPIINNKNEITMVFEIKRTIEQPAEKLKKDESKQDRSVESIDAESDKGEALSSYVPTKVGYSIKSGFKILDEYLFKIFLEFVKKRIEVINSTKIVMMRTNRAESIIDFV